MDITAIVPYNEASRTGLEPCAALSTTLAIWEQSIMAKGHGSAHSRKVQPVNAYTSVRISPERAADAEVGQQFGRLTVIGREFLLAMCKRRFRSVVAECRCGRIVCVPSVRLTGGRTRSCGCLLRDFASKINYIHGLSGHPLGAVWQSMKARCGSKANAAWKDYGGRGVSVCHEWRTSFRAFYEWALSHGWQPGLQLDRIDNDGNYEPSNCRFATSKEQLNNTRANRLVTAFGETKTAVQWSEDDRCAVCHRTLLYRLKAGWGDVDAVTTPQLRRIRQSVVSAEIVAAARGAFRHRLLLECGCIAYQRVRDGQPQSKSVLCKAHPVAALNCKEAEAGK